MFPYQGCEHIIRWLACGLLCRLESSCIDSPVRSHRLCPGDVSTSAHSVSGSPSALSSLLQGALPETRGILFAVLFNRLLPSKQHSATCAGVVREVFRCLLLRRALGVVSATSPQLCRFLFLLPPSRLERSRNRLCPIFDLFFGHGCSLVRLVRLCGTARSSER